MPSDIGMGGSVIPVSRAALAIFALAFALNHAALGLTWFNVYRHPVMASFAFAIYLVCVIPSIVLYRGLTLPKWQTAANLAAALVVPWLCFSQLAIDDISVSGNYLTWFVGGIETLMAITVIRNRVLFGWLGLFILVLQAYLWGGLSVFGSIGIVGAVVIVLAATAVSRGLQTTALEAQKYSDAASATAANTARAIASRAERKTRIEGALRAAQPVLQRIIDLNGKLTEADKHELQLTESALRDEVYGKNLMDDGVRIAARDARRRGVEVTIFDAGGMDDASAEVASGIRTSIARAIESAHSGTVAIRSPKGENFMVAITAQRPEASGPDLWLRLP